MMSLRHLAALAALMATPLTAGLSQTFDAQGRPLVTSGLPNVGAAQVAVAQARLPGSMLVLYRTGREAGDPARVVVATRTERLVVDVDPETFAVKTLSRERTGRALPAGQIVCRSYAPIDRILGTMRKRGSDGHVRIIPPHRPADSWRVGVGARWYRIAEDERGEMTLLPLTARDKTRPA